MMQVFNYNKTNKFTKIKLLSAAIGIALLSGNINSTEATSAMHNAFQPKKVHSAMHNAFSVTQGKQNLQQKYFVCDSCVLIHFEIEMVRKCDDQCENNNRALLRNFQLFQNAQNSKIIDAQNFLKSAFQDKKIANISETSLPLSEFAGYILSIPTHTQKVNDEMIFQALKSSVRDDQGTFDSQYAVASCSLKKANSNPNHIDDAVILQFATNNVYDYPILLLLRTAENIEILAKMAKIYDDQSRKYIEVYLNNLPNIINRQMRIEERDKALRTKYWPQSEQYDYSLGNFTSLFNKYPERILDMIKNGDLIICPIKLNTKGEYVFQVYGDPKLELKGLTSVYRKR